MLDVKALLTKMLESYATIPTCCYIGASTGNHASSTTGTWYRMNAFGGHAYSHINTDTDYFGTDINGVIIKRNGIYRLSLSSHMNCAATNTVLETRFHNYTKDSAYTGVRFLVTGAATYGQLSNDMVVSLTNVSANGDIVTPQFAKYSSAASLFRASQICYTVQLIQPL